MNLIILLPYLIFKEIINVSSITAETSEGSFGILPNRLDCVAAIVPSIFSYDTESSSRHYLAVDAGILVKTGSRVTVSVRNAFSGTDLGKLYESVQKEYKKLDLTEKNMRASMAKMESGFLLSMKNFQKE